MLLVKNKRLGWEKMVLFNVKTKESYFEDEFKKEEALKNLVYDNLFSIFGIKPIKKEFPIAGKSIDILGYDLHHNLCIIEFKKSRTISVMDQILHYFHLTKKNKSQIEKYIKEGLIDFKFSRMICIASDFSERELDALEEIPYSNDFNIEFIEYDLYNNNFVSFKTLRNSNQNYFLFDFWVNLSPEQKALIIHFLEKYHSNLIDIMELSEGSDGFFLEYKKGNKLFIKLEPDIDNLGQINLRIKTNNKIEDQNLLLKEFSKDNELLLAHLKSKAEIDNVMSYITEANL